ncbi:winged helix-turn-helix transcriptional regulator [Pelagibius litoralis]|uniref:Winged helix-turn-helix transcriptional regulator n=1 Tax=Pelagibius litoralis TaxID=374515 RepID=A0A967F2N4_9PROT|nr:metalloregulator ArsR/SmtB family transcription factor [Pelagibius litoralis]NIA71899.1 winged helix-turn-helix transcriptional regulator [Pelagibius litoralis]
MVEYSEQALDRTFSALADPTRRAILGRLMSGEARVTEIAEPFEMSLNAVSKHVAVLERAGLVRRDVQGRVHQLSFEGAPILEAARWMEETRRFWEARLDALEAFLEKAKAKNTPPDEKETKS